MNVNGANQETLRRAEKKLCELAKELKKNWDLGQNKTKLKNQPKKLLLLYIREPSQITFALRGG